MPDLEQATDTSKGKNGAEGRYVVRFTRAQRYFTQCCSPRFWDWRRRGFPCASARAFGRAVLPAQWEDSEPSSSSTSYAPWS